MITYNTSFILSPSDEQNLINFIKAEYLPLAVKDNVLKSPLLKKVDQPQEEAQATAVYALSFEVDSREDLAKHLSSYEQELLQLLNAKFGERVMSFSTIMEHIQL